MLHLLREERFEHTPARALCGAMAGLFPIATGKHMHACFAFSYSGSHDVVRMRTHMRRRSYGYHMKKRV